MQLRLVATFAFASLFTATGALAAPAQENQIVLATPDFNITTRDFHYYVESTIPEEQRQQVLSREGSVRKIYENLYVIRAFAQRGANNDVIPREELEWMTEHYQDRLLMNRQIQNEVAAAMEDIDWEQAAREEYSANREKYKRSAQVNADHILIDTEERSEEEALARAQEAREKVQGNASFEEVALEYSDDPSVKQNSGSLGFFAKNKMVKPFSEAAFAMNEPGEVSDPVKTKFGYHIIRFNERKEAQVPPFEQVKDRIIASLKKTRAKKLRADIISEVESGSEDLGLQVNTELLQKLEKQYAGDGKDESVESTGNGEE